MNTNLAGPTISGQQAPADGMPQGAPRKKTAKQWLADYRWVLLIALADLLLWLFWPSSAAPVLRNTWDYLRDWTLDKSACLSLDLNN